MYEWKLSPNSFSEKGDYFRACLILIDDNIWGRHPWCLSSCGDVLDVLSRDFSIFQYMWMLSNALLELCG